MHRRDLKESYRYGERGIALLYVLVVITLLTFLVYVSVYSGGYTGESFTAISQVKRLSLLGHYGLSRAVGEGQVFSEEPYPNYQVFSGAGSPSIPYEKAPIPFQALSLLGSDISQVEFSYLYSATAQYNGRKAVSRRIYSAAVATLWRK